MIVVTIVVRRSSGEKIAARLGRFNVPAARFCTPDRRFRQERAESGSAESAGITPGHQAYTAMPHAGSAISRPKPLQLPEGWRHR